MAYLSRLFAARGVLRIWVVGCSVTAIATLVLAASAQAIVTSVSTETGTAIVGLQPRNGTNLYTEGETPFTFSNKEGNPVLHTSNVYAIYWDPKDEYHGDWQHLIDGFLRDLGAASGSFANVLTVDEQYTDKANEGAAHVTTFRGAYTDTEPYPVLGNCTDPHPLALGDRIACLTDRQLQQQLEHFITTHTLQKGMGTIFYLLTPPGVTVCVDAGGPTGHCSDSLPAPSASYSNSFCSYHSDVSPTNPLTGDANTILYAVIPWTAGGLADGHLAPEDRTPAYDCQDGGFDPSSSHPVEQREKGHERGTKEKEELEKASPEEQQKAKEAEEREGPHQQEPNAPSGVGPDGYYDTGLADLIVNQIAVEQQNTTTDPLLDAWQDSRHNEVTDECRNFFAPSTGGSVQASENTDAGTLFNQSLGEGNYYLNTAFNLAALKLPYPGVPCIPGIRLQPSFTAPNPVNAGDLVGLNGMESDITLDAGTKFSSSGTEGVNYSLFTWNFGDGTPTVTGYAPGGPTLNSPSADICNSPWLEPCAASTFHSYQYGGIYQVTLTASDVAGNTVSVTHPITVNGPPPPPPPAPPSSGPGGSGSSSSSTPSQSAAPAAPALPVIPGPVAQAVASNRSLTQALRRGLLVNYSVNEQVAGRFEVLLESRTAHRLGITGTAAVGLPAGSPPSLIVGRAILITTKGGHSTVRIKLSKSATERLRHVRKLTVMLRLVVRNAATQNPQSATVLSTVVLHR